MALPSLRMQDQSSHGLILNPEPLCACEEQQFSSFNKHQKSKTTGGSVKTHIPRLHILNFWFTWSGMMVMDREAWMNRKAWHAAVLRLQRVRQNWVTKLNWSLAWEQGICISNTSSYQLMWMPLVRDHILRTTDLGLSLRKMTTPCSPTTWKPE